MAQETLHFDCFTSPLELHISVNVELKTFESSLAPWLITTLISLDSLGPFPAHFNHLEIYLRYILYSLSGLEYWYQITGILVFFMYRLHVGYTEDKFTIDLIVSVRKFSCFVPCTSIASSTGSFFPLDSTKHFL